MPRLAPNRLDWRSRFRASGGENAPRLLRCGNDAIGPSRHLIATQRPGRYWGRSVHAGGTANQSFMTQNPDIGGHILL